MMAASMTETLQPVDVPTATTSTVVAASVTAVVVTRGVTPYLATTLAALAAQTRSPLRVLVVDAAPKPRGGVATVAQEALRATAARVRVVETPGARSFGHAVRAALASDADGPLPTWLWLLHDDSAPAPDALAELSRAVGRARSVAVAGVKQRTWTDPERLLEVGVRTSLSGRRMTDVEPGELDQGQHDVRDDVLGVGLAGALVRRDVWEELGGTDPALGPFGDGFDLSRRARLAGHRVVVVPSAVVRHAQASYLGLREVHPTQADVDGDGFDDLADPRRSFAARRRAQLHLRLVGAPLLLLPVVVAVTLAAAVVRALVQVAAKQPGLAVDELRAALAALARPVAVARARRRQVRTRRVARRTLRPLQASYRDVWTQWRDRRLARAEARKVVQAPSELELRELAAIATRRRVALGALTAVLLVVTGVALGRLVGPVASGARLVGDALAPAVADLPELWRAATSGWVAGGLGAPGPADALLAVLLPGTVLTGSTGPVVGLLVLGGTVLSGLGAWAAAGAATRSTVVRAWAALVWATWPVVLLAVGQGRLGAVVAHAALPWAALGLARAVGVNRVDRVLSGLATARYDDEADAADEAERPHVSERDVATPAHGVPRAVAHDGPHPGVAGSGVDADTPSSGGTDAGSDAQLQEPPARTGLWPAALLAAQPAPTYVGAPEPTGSIGAAAGASLALVALVAGAPSLLVPVTLAVLVAALAAPSRRGRLLLVMVPAVVVSAPTLLAASARGFTGWRLLVAGPGLPSATEPAGVVERLLGVPSDASSLVPAVLPAPLAAVWPGLLGAVVVVLAVLALLRGGGAARAVRAAWVVAAIGVGAAGLVAVVPVGVDEGRLVHGWAGPALSLAGAGLLAAAVLGADGARQRLRARSFGWRQPVVALLTAVAVLVPVAWTTTWAVQARAGLAAPLSTSDAVVPAIGLQAQDEPASSRVLALALTPAGEGRVVRWQLLRTDGPTLVDDAAAVSTRVLTGDLLDPEVADPDSASEEVSALAGRLASGSGTDLSAELGAVAVADVLVPPLEDRSDRAAKRLRDDLLARLDSTPGLERVTQGATGTLWRVAPADGGEVVTSWARLVPGGASAAPAQAQPLASQDRTVRARVPAGAADRRVVLAERADSQWRATLDGTPLRAVDDGWRQTFELGPDGGTLVVSYEAPYRTWWLVAQGVVLLVAVLLALPVRRRRGVRA